MIYFVLNVRVIYFLYSFCVTFKTFFVLLCFILLFHSVAVCSGFSPDAVQNDGRLQSVSSPRLFFFLSFSPSSSSSSSLVCRCTGVVFKDDKYE